MKKKPTKAESEHMAKVAALGCIVRLWNDRCGQPAECHHIRHQVGAGRRSSHFHTIPLCPTHHRHGNHGTAIHSGKVTWERKFGTELELLAQVREMLE